MALACACPCRAVSNDDPRELKPSAGGRGNDDDDMGGNDLPPPPPNGLASYI